MTKIKELEPGNYYGNLSIKEESGKYYWAVKGYSGYDWEEIDFDLYSALLKHWKKRNEN